MGSYVRTLCCCGGELSDDEGPLIGDNHEDSYDVGRLLLNLQ